MGKHRLLSRPDSRPVLASVLGGSWVVLCAFCILRALLLMAGLSGGIELGAHDPNDIMAAEYPEFVDDSWFEAEIVEHEARALERQAGLPLLLLSALGVWGGVQLLRRRPRAPWLLAGAGLGVVALGAWQTHRFLVLTGYSTAGVEIPSEATLALGSIAWLNVALQALPVAIGLGLLRHPSLREWLRPVPASARGTRSPG